MPFQISIRDDDVNSLFKLGEDRAPNRKRCCSGKEEVIKGTALAVRPKSFMVQSGPWICRIGQNSRAQFSPIPINKIDDT